MAKIIGNRLEGKRVGTKIETCFITKDEKRIPLGLLNLDDFNMLKRDAHEFFRFILVALPERRDRKPHKVMVDEDFTNGKKLE